jgi:TatD DNase family protein
MHCFTGSHDFARKLLNLNSYFSASGIITFKNSSELRNAFSFIPNEKIIIETDSPFLAPTPMRGKTNEPGFIKYTLEKLAEIKKLTLENMDEVTTNNFNTLFSVK